MYSRAYSSPHGYDMRTPYNIRMGDIKKMAVVRPFSTRSLQRNTVVEGFTPKPRFTAGKYRETYLGFPMDSAPPSQYIQVIRGPSCGQYCYSVVDAQQPCSYQDVQIGKLYKKGQPRVK